MKRYKTITNKKPQYTRIQLAEDDGIDSMGRLEALLLLTGLIIFILLF